MNHERPDARARRDETYCVLVATSMAMLQRPIVEDPHSACLHVFWAAGRPVGAIRGPTHMECVFNVIIFPRMFSRGPWYARV